MQRKIHCEGSFINMKAKTKATSLPDEFQFNVHTEQHKDQRNKLLSLSVNEP